MRARASPSPAGRRAGWLIAAAAIAPLAAADEPAGIVLRPAGRLAPAPRGTAALALPADISARELRGRPDLETEALGDVDFRRAGLRLRADRVRYDLPEDLARASGGVRVDYAGNIYRGTEVQMKVQRFEGFLLDPTYFFGATHAGGSAARIDFIDADHAVATAATYTGCTPDGRGAPAWLLQADRVTLDFERNEGVAEGASLRFLGTTLLTVPRLSFPLSDQRKSGWLPPALTLDNRNGLQTAVPYYWNIAPNRDATFTPAMSTRRGAGIDGEYRYLEPRFAGRLYANLLPHDRVKGRVRYGLDVAHDGRTESGWDVRVRSLRVSDDDYWKDFPRTLRLLTPRLLPTDLQATRTRGWNALPSLADGPGDWTAYVRLQRWQPIRDADPASRIEAPYERVPQIGARTRQRLGSGLEGALETEINRFAPPAGFDEPGRFAGVRVHAVGALSRPVVTPGWTLTPRYVVNAASYALDRPLDDGRTHASRTIPTFSLDSAWLLERDTAWFGRALRQTLEPRLRYVRTPFRRQATLPNFDAAQKDFNVYSI